jgi:hypothetical protein
MATPTLHEVSGDIPSSAGPTDTQAQLHRHAEAAARVRDVTGNGISVAGGWLEALASGSLDAETRERAVTSARRRLSDVQHAVDDFIQATFDVLHERGGSRVVDLARVWAMSTSTPLEGAAEQDLQVLAHEPSLRAFLVEAADLLIPEANVRSGQICIRLVDAGRLGVEARSSLKASRGSLSGTRTGGYACWDRAEA